MVSGFPVFGFSIATGYRNRASARSKVFATIYEGWGTKHEKVTRKTVTLVEGKEMLELLTVSVEK